MNIIIIMIESSFYLILVCSYVSQGILDAIEPRPGNKNMRQFGVAHEI